MVSSEIAGGALRAEGRYRVFADVERRCGRFPRGFYHRIGYLSLRVLLEKSGVYVGRIVGVGVLLNGGSIGPPGVHSFVSRQERGKVGSVGTDRAAAGKYRRHV
jgi:hypothetical protein